MKSMAHMMHWTFSIKLRLISKYTKSQDHAILILSPSPSHRRSTSNNHISPILSHTPKPPIKQLFQPKQVPNPPVRPDATIDPALSENRPDRTQEQGYKDALKAWARFRFVRAGWFTPSEAIDYID